LALLQIKIMCSKQVENTATVLAFSDQQKGLVTSNKNNQATYTANKGQD